MIFIEDLGISDPTKDALAVEQAKVDSASTFGAQILIAKMRFTAVNTKQNTAFTEIRSQLGLMCSGARRCMYCEDSVADEVEHHHPKNHFPDKCFIWVNYLYACGPCNGPKNNKFALFTIDGTEIHLAHPKGEEPKPPPIGDSMLIHPRFEDPMSLLFLDLSSTFLFTPLPNLDQLEASRANYTIRILGLNTRDYLVSARREAFESYSARLTEYAIRRDNQEIERAELAKAAILRMQHPTVFREIVRQGHRLPGIAEILSKYPEIMNW